MMARYCDLCNKLFRKDVLKSMTLSGRYNNPQIFELCESCLGKFDKFFEEINSGDVEEDVCRCGGKCGEAYE